MNRVIVIGAGAAGLMAAISAAETGAKVSLLEKMLVMKNVPWPMIFMWIVCVNTSLNTSVC